MFWNAALCGDDTLPRGMAGAPVEAVTCPSMVVVPFMLLWTLVYDTPAGLGVTPGLMMVRAVDFVTSLAIIISREVFERAAPIAGPRPFPADASFGNGTPC